MESWRQFSTGLVCLLLLLLVEIAESRSLRHNGEQYKAKAVSHLETKYETSDPYDYVGSPFSLPPYGEATGPASSSTRDYPPFCIYPPLTPLPPSTIPYLPSPPPEFTNPPEFPVPSPPEDVPNPRPPAYEPNPPIVFPSPTGFVPSPPPPSYVVPGTPGFVPSPQSPSYVFPSPPEFVPGTPIFLPPVVYPSPVTPPPASELGRWCVAKPTVPDPIIEEAMNYACGSGADCDSIQPSGPCFEPNTMIGHASFAFNSFWQRTKVAGGTCDFGGTAMMITKDPSYDGCHFIIY
ncbi:uncharacterized protein LOC141848237 [Curcuma longa]|uniref:uncharacterized protein LOC141848237 n=1 Tax=Curcuma longa TaxID=136217 RepID=UPI003D9E150D